MPRPLDPGSLAAGGGLAAKNSVEASAFVHPTQGLDGLIAHITDPSRAHMARAIGIVDAGGLFVSDDVEGALQELAGGTGSGFLNGLITGGTFTSVGLNITLATPTTVLLGGTVHDYSGATLGLTPGVTQYVYIDAGTATLTTALAAPALPAEPILLWEITTDGVGVTGSRDARFFVRTIDRKPPFTIRSDGTAGNRNAEGNFESLEAAFLWLELYAGTGSTPIENHRILVRGSHVLSRSYGIPVPGVILEGDGDASFVTGAVLSPMFNTGANADIRFRNLVLSSNHAGSTGVYVSGARFMMENCRIIPGTGTWDTGVRQFTGANRMTIRDGYIEAQTYGIRTIDPDRLRLIDTEIVGPITGITGLLLGSLALATDIGQSEVRGCRITGFDLSTDVCGCDQTFTDCTFRGARQGAYARRSAAKFRHTTFRNVTITLDATVGESGIICEQNRSVIEDCEITNPRTVWAGIATPYGINLSHSSATECKLKSNRISGFWNTALPNGVGIYLTSGSNMVSDCTLGTNWFGLQISNNAQHNRISGCSSTDCVSGIVSQSGTDDTRVTDCYVLTSTTSGTTGIALIGADSQVTGCRVVNGRNVFVGGELQIGIYIQGARNIVSDCLVDNFLNTADNTGRGIYISGLADDARVTDCTVTTAQYGIEAPNAARSGLQVANCTFKGVMQGIRSLSSYTIVDGCQVTLDATRGLYGIEVQGPHSTVSSCILSNPRNPATYLVGDVPVGVWINNAADDVTVADVDINGFYNSVGDTGLCIYGVGATNRVTINGGTMETAKTGILLSGGSACRVEGVNVENVETGIDVGAAYSTVTGCTVSVDSTRGVRGVYVNADNVTVTGCTLFNGRVVYAAEIPAGVDINGDYAKVMGCTIRGWQNVGVTGFGIGSLPGASAGRCTIEGNTIEDCHFGFYSDNAAATPLVAGNLFLSLGAYGVYIDNAEGAKVTGNTLDSPGSTGIVIANCTDLEVVGNKVLGGTVTATQWGIRIDGLDTAANRVRRFVISDNNVRQITTQGILVNGYVQNGVVSANHVDGGLTADPFNPTATAGIKLVSFAGGNQVKDVSVTGNTVWRCQTGIIAVGTYDDPIWNLTITGNTVHHCGLAWDGITVVDSFDGAGSKGIGVDQGRGIVISGNTVRKIGQLINSNDLEAFPTTGGPAVTSVGIYCRNCTQLDVGGNHVEDSMSDGMGSGNGIVIEQRTSGVGVGGTFATAGIVVGDNEVLWNAGLAGNGPGNYGVAVTASLGGDPPTASHFMLGVDITGNSTTNTAFSGIIVSAGDRTNMRGLVVSNNSVYSADGDGVQILLFTVLVLGNTFLEDLNVTGNTVLDAASDGISVFGASVSSRLGRAKVADNVVRAAGANGVYVSAGTGIEVDDVSVIDNQLVVIGQRGIYAYGNHPTTFQGFTISGNRIEDATNEGIRFESIDTDSGNLSILGNSVYGASGGAALGVGIRVFTTAIVTTAVDVSHLTVSDNQVWSDTNNGIVIDVEGVLSQAVIADNLVQVNSTGYPLWLDLDTPATILIERYSEDIAITGNTFKGGARVQVIVDHGQKLQNFTFSDNIRHNSEDHGFLLQVSNATVGTNIAVSGVTISGNAFESINAQAIRLLLGDTTTPIDGAVNLSVTDNRFTTCNTGGVADTTVYVRGLCVLRNLTVSDNQFLECGTVDEVTSGIVHLLFGSGGGTNTGEDVHVTNNSFNSCYGVGIFVEDNSAGATTWTLVGLKVEGNTFQQQVNNAILLDLAAYTDVRATSIAGNVIDTVSGTARDAGIIVLGPSAADVNVFSVQGNSVREANSEGIRLDFPAGGNAVAVRGNTVRNSGLQSIILNIGGTMTGLVVDDNLVYGGTYGVAVNATGANTNISVSRNEVHSPSGYGVLFASGTSTTDNLSVDGNKVFEGSIAVGVTLGAALIAGSISRNVVQDCSSYGVYLVTDNVSARTYSALSISGNTVQNSGSTGIRVNDRMGHVYNDFSVDDNTVNGAGGTAILFEFHPDDSTGVEYHTFSVSRNKILAPATHGISFSCAAEGASRENVAFDDNLITDPANNGIYFRDGNDDIVLFFPSLSGAPYYGISFSGNQIVSPGGSGIYLYIMTEESIYALHCDRNTIRAPGSHGIVFTGLIMDPSAGSPAAPVVESTSFSDNIIDQWGDGYVGIQFNLDEGNWYGTGSLTRPDLTVWRVLTASNNKLFCNQDNSYGIQFRNFQYDIRALVMNGNNARLAGTSPRGFIVDLATDGTSFAGGPVAGDSWMFSGNLVYAATPTVVPVPAAAWPPTNSLCVGNGSNGTVGNADRWADFSAGFTISQHNT